MSEKDDPIDKRGMGSAKNEAAAVLIFKLLLNGVAVARKKSAASFLVFKQNRKRGLILQSNLKNSQNSVQKTQNGITNGRINRKKK